MVENGGNASKAMVDAGYSPNTAKTPSKLTESKGYLEMLDKFGLTEELILTSLVEDIKSKPGNRKAELELGVKIRGMLVSGKALSNDNYSVRPLPPIALVEFV